MKKRKLILHIGTGKTGTTALQSFLAINNELLNKNGFHYLNAPKWGDNSHHLLGFAIWGKEHLGLPDIPEIDFEKLKEKITSEVNNLPENIEKIIISSELFFELACTSKIELLKSFVYPLFNEITIVSYLRRQDDHIQSLYQHWIKTGQKTVRGKTIKQFVSEFKGDDYFEKLNCWASHFGKENIVVRVYEKNQLVEKSIFSDFADAINLKSLKEFKNPPKSKSNLSINPEATEILRLCDFLDNKLLEELWPDATKKNLTDYSLLTSVEKLEILEKFKSSNQKVAKDYLGREDGELFFDQPKNENPLGISNNEMPFEYLVPTLLSIFNNQHQKLAETEKKLAYLKKKEIQLQGQIEEIISQSSAPQMFFALSPAMVNRINHGLEIQSLSYKNGELNIVSSGNDPSVFIDTRLKFGDVHFFKLIIDCPEDTITQLFFIPKGDDKFSEPNSISINSTKGINHHSIKLPKEIGPKLRLDPGNLPGNFVIKLLQIV